jgi:hypothetical protein
MGSPTQSQMASPRDTLYLLPPELRNNVYGELFFDEGSTVHINSRGKNQHRVAVLSTSRLYFQEAASFFYSQSHFVFERPPIPTPDAKVLAPIADRYVRYLKRITINLHAGHTSLPKVRQAAQMIAALVDTGASFDEININIGTGLYNFMNLRFDDSVLDRNHCITLALQQLVSSHVSKRICIGLDRVWFAPGVAAQFESELSTESGICERKLLGRYYHDPIVFFGTTSDSDDIGESPIPPTSPSSLLSLMDLDSDWDGIDSEQDVNSEEELTSDDDLDMEDLAPAGHENAKMKMFIDFLPDMI